MYLERIYTCTCTHMYICGGHYKCDLLEVEVRVTSGPHSVGIGMGVGTE